MYENGFLTVNMACFGTKMWKLSQLFTVTPNLLFEKLFESLPTAITFLGDTLLGSTYAVWDNFVWYSICIPPAERNVKAVEL